jgi:hypothetical protein
MNPRTLRSLEQMLDRLERGHRRSGRRLSAATLALVAGLFLGDLLLAVLVPRVWPVLLGTDPGVALRGWPLFVWRLSELSVRHQQGILVALLTFSLVTVMLSYRLRFVRLLVWVAALGVVFADAGILLATILACLQAAGGGL